MEKNNFLFIGNSSYENRGNEAIIRGTINILDKAFGENNNIYNIDSFFYSPKIYENQKSKEYDKRINHAYASPYTQMKDKLNIGFILTRAAYRLKKYGYFEGLNLKNKQKRHENTLQAIKECKVALSLGGDNYSLCYGLPRLLTDIDDLVLSYKKPLIIWGASVGPFSNNPAYEKYMMKHLKDITAIFAREDKTIEYLSSIGIDKNVYRVSDPAFVMEPIKPENFENDFPFINESIGINFSPIMPKYWTDNDMNKWMSFCVELVEKISDKTRRPIYLLPHVTHIGSNNDYVLLKNIKEQLEPLTEKVHLVSPGYSAAEFKYIISQFNSYMGARTHSTIAAFSSCVPTVSLAYSMKAVGINKEVFNHLDFCVEKNKINRINYIVDLLNTIIENNDKIRQEMKPNINAIKQKALKSGEILKDIIEKV